MKDQPLTPETKLIHAGRDPHANHGVVNPPIYRASTILHPTLEAWEKAWQPGFTGYRYGRRETPTSRSVESAICELYGADHCIAVCSGMGAIALTLLGLCKAGDHILVTDSVYASTRTFCDDVLSQYGIATEYYDPIIGADIATLLQPETSVVYTESPGSLTFEVQDIPAIARAVKRHGVKVVSDNTWATALHFNPLDHGADVVVEAATKYISGHSDVLLGVIAGRGELARQVYARAKAMGMCSGSEELYAAQRGLRTMALRLKQSGQTGLQLAQWLARRPEVTRVFHPALPGSPGHDTWRRDFGGCSGLFSFQLHPVPKAALAAFYDNLSLFGIGASWGGYESLAMPANPHHSRTASGGSASHALVRLYAGLEDPVDLLRDLEHALARMAEAARRSPR
jgi:cystathionine beta-lyase